MIAHNSNMEDYMGFKCNIKDIYNNMDKDIELLDYNEEEGKYPTKINYDYSTFNFYNSSSIISDNVYEISSELDYYDENEKELDII